MFYHSKSSIQQKEYYLHQQIRPKFKEGTGKMSHLWKLRKEDQILEKF